MKDIQVAAASILLNDGVLSLTERQARDRKHALKPLGEEGLYEIAQAVQFKRGEVFGFAGSLSKLAKGQVKVLGEEFEVLEDEEPLTLLEVQPPMVPAPPVDPEGDESLPPDAQVEIKTLAAVLDLNIKETVALLKEEFGTEAKNGSSLISLDVFDQAVSEFTTPVDELAQELGKTTEELLAYLKETHGKEFTDGNARVSNDLVEQVSKDLSGENDA